MVEFLPANSENIIQAIINFLSSTKVKGSDKAIAESLSTGFQSGSCSEYLKQDYDNNI